MQAKRYSYSCKQNFNETTTNIIQHLASPAAHSANPPNQFLFHSDAAEAALGVLLAQAGFLCRVLSTRHSSKARSRGFQVAPGCPTARGAQMPSAAARALSSGRRRGISSSLTACSARTLARGRVLVTAAGKECVERGNKNGETWKASPAKRDKHTHDTQIIAAASQPAGKRRRGSGFWIFLSYW